MNVCVAHLPMNACVAKIFGAWTEKVGHACPTFMAHPTRVGRKVGALHKKFGHPCFKAWLAACGAWQQNSASEEASFKDAGSNPTDALH